MLCELQLLLFVDLPVPEIEPRPRVRRKRPQLTRSLWQQLQLTLVTVRAKAAKDHDADTEYDYPAHRIVSAASLPAPAFSAPRSVFDLASFGIVSGMTSCPAAQVHRRVIREDGITRHVAMRYQDTQEWADKEQARRARQRPPKPTKGAKTMSGKLRELVGAG